MAEILFLDANWDEITKYCCAFRTAIVVTPLGEHNTHAYTHLTGPQMVQPDVDSIVKSHNYSFISGAGHGLYSIFKGHDGREIWRANGDLSHLRGRIVHLLSCQTGASLGRAMITQGAKAFWGYTERFLFLHKKNPPADRETDSIAEDALRMDCLIDTEILDGRPAHVVYETVTNYVAELCERGLPKYRRDVVLSNYRHLVCPMTVWGDPSATINTD